jgi:acetoin utilization deacetylase AcuC-like enzyme
MKAFYSDRFVLPLPAGHRFPMQKYYLLRERVQAELPDIELDEASIAADSELARVHAADYIERVVTGALDAREQREIGFPWSPEMMERSRRSVGATIAACHAACRGGFAVNLAGGYGRDIDVTVDIHLQTIQLAAVAFGARRDSCAADTLRSANFI